MNFEKNTNEEKLETNEDKKIEEVKEIKEEVFDNEEDIKKTEEQDVEKTAEVREDIKNISETTEEFNERMVKESQEIEENPVLYDLLDHNKPITGDVNYSHDTFIAKIKRKFKEKYFPKKILSKEEINDIVSNLQNQINDKLKELKEEYNDQNESGRMIFRSIKKNEETGEYSINAIIHKNYGGKYGSQPVSSEVRNYKAKVEDGELIWKG